MKTSFKMMLALLTLALAMPAYAEKGKGGQTSGGGDTVAFEFVSYGKTLAKMMRNDSRFSQSFPQIVIADFAKLADSVKVESREKLQLESNPDLAVDAVCYPTQALVLVNKARWLGMDSVRRKYAKISLVAHEYLQILGLEGSNDYSLSTQVIEYFYDPKPPFPYKLGCDLTQLVERKLEDGRIVRQRVPLDGEFSGARFNWTEFYGTELFRGLGYSTPHVAFQLRYAGLHPTAAHVKIYMAGGEMQGRMIHPDRKIVDGMLELSQEFLKFDSEINLLEKPVVVRIPRDEEVSIVESWKLVKARRLELTAVCRAYAWDSL